MAPLLHASTQTADAELLSYGQILLKHFKDVIVNLFACPKGLKISLGDNIVIPQFKPSLI